MKNDPFWQSAKVLLRYRAQLAVAGVGALISAGCFGAGLGMLIYVFKLLLADRKSLHDMVADLVDKHLTGPRVPALVHDAGLWVVAHLPEDPFRGFVTIMAVIAALTIVGSVGRYIHEFITLTVSQRAALVWRGRMFRRLIHAPMGQVLERGNADHISRIVNDTGLLEVGYRSILGKTTAELTKGAAALGAAIWLDWKLTMLALVAAPLIATVLRKFGKRIRRAAKKAMQQRGRIVGALNEALGGLSVVKVHNAEGYERRRFGRVNRDLFAQEMRMRQARALSSPVIDTVALLAVMGAASIAAWFIFGHGEGKAVEPEKYFTVLVMLGAAGNSLKPLTALHNQLSEASAAATRVLETVALPVEPVGVDAPRGAPKLPRHHQSILFDDVTYRYPSAARPAVAGVTLSVTHGQTVAIVGSNGSGKTTLLSMLPRLLLPESGKVVIDGVDAASVSLRSLRGQMAVVTQQNVLFEGTIAQNIAYGRRHEPMERIVSAAKAAFADEFIASLPLGYNAPLGEGGAGLSGGQRQRICIARAVLRDPAILILDEATSQIDADSEAKINMAIRALRKGRTIFVIAHRLSTVVDADLIVVMADGQIVDRGTHAELLTRCAMYQTLTQTQLVQTRA
ncbi:MAG: ABC transporter ATP-binding protein [Planctomycetota bacterium]|nr:ABC transporter ATP-binding protein [Planctomycetota bacterium]